jgi:hypothetical protein
MQLKAVFLIALLAPHSAAAFGDLDCTTYVTCSQDSCMPLVTPFAVTFNWTDMTATLINNGIATVLAHNLNASEPLGTSATRSMSLNFADFNGTGPDKLLSFETATGKIDALYSFPNARGIGETWAASCDLQTST